MRIVRHKRFILDNFFFRQEFRGEELFEEIYDEITIPDGVTSGVAPEIYNAYREGRDSACVDIVISTRLENGKAAVLLSKRAPNVCYSNKWWIYGGALQAYRSLEDFVGERAEKECGVPVKPRAVVGTYRTESSDQIGSTLQVCYAAIVSIEDIRAHKKVDDAHSNVRLFTLEELPEQENDEHHWYPLHVVKLVLTNMPK